MFFERENKRFCLNWRKSRSKEYMLKVAYVILRLQADFFLPVLQASSDPAGIIRQKSSQVS